MPDQRLRLAPGTPSRQARLRVAAPFLPLLSEAKARAPQLSELLHGQDFDIHARKGHWAYGRVRALLPSSRRTDYVGWVDARGLQDIAGRPTHVVHSLSAPVFQKPDLKSHIVMSLPLGSRLGVIGDSGDYLQVGAGAWMHSAHLRPIRAHEAEPVRVARRYLGQPYVWGGNGARGVDCSGLVQMALSACGVDCPRDADQQEIALGDALSTAEIATGHGRAGDLLFWPGHVGMLTGARRLLHANAHHMGVVEEPLGPALRRMASKGIELRAVRRLAT